MLAAAAAGAPRVHEHWKDNLFLETSVGGAIAAVAAAAPVKVSRTIRTARQCMAPLEGKGVVAYWDRQAEQLVLHTATQMPHIVRSGLSECLGVTQDAIRVIAPDVGGGFGWKGLLQPEEVVAAWLAMRLGQPVRWTEDRREHLVGGANAREHHYEITAYADERGRLLGVEPRSRSMPAPIRSSRSRRVWKRAQVGGILPGPYDFPHYRCHTFSVATNKPPIVPYRGVARPTCASPWSRPSTRIARAVGRESREVRVENLVPPEKMPFDNITGKHFDSGDYPELVRRAVAGIDLAGVRARQQQGEPDGRLIGVGLATYCEQGGARHRGLSRLGHPDGFRARAGAGAHHAGRRAGTARRRRSRTDRAWKPRWRRSRTKCWAFAGAHQADPRRHGADAVFHRHLWLALAW